MLRPRLDLVIRILTIFSLLLSSFPPSTASANHSPSPDYQPSSHSPEAPRPNLPNTRTNRQPNQEQYIPRPESADLPLPASGPITSTLYLPVIMSDGQSAALTSQDAISSTVYLPLIMKNKAGLHANFEAQPLTGTAPLTVTFTNLSTGAKSYHWNFGDAVTSTTATLTQTHTYTQAGVYTVTLTAGDAKESQTLTRANYIAVSQGPAGTITEQGGTITSTDGRVRLDFASGAVTETLEVFIDQTNLIEEYETPEGDTIQALVPDGLPFRLLEFTTKQTDGTLRSDLQFQAPVTLTVGYVTDEITGLIESTLTLLYHNPDTETLAVIPTDVQTETGQLTGVIAHFSTYGVGGESATWSTPSIDAFNVAFSKGSASYSYDVPLPAGPGGFGPKLTLQHNSGIVNGLFGDVSPDTGWVGTGWTLELGQITWQTVGSRKVPGQRSSKPVYDFHLTLNGTSEGLLPTDLPLDYDTRHFYTEHQTFMSIEAPGRVDKMGHSQTGSWQVVDQTGTTYYFGNNEAGQGSILLYGSTYDEDRGCSLYKVTYKLYKVIDIHGNTIEIEYDHDQGVDGCEKIGDRYRQGSTRNSYPKLIKYTTNDRAGDEQAEYEIEFITAAKGYGGPFDGIITKGDVRKKLTDIEIRYVPPEGEKQVIRRIHFEYDTDIVPERRERKHLLTSLQIIDQNGNTLPETSFSYVERPIRDSWLNREHADWEWGTSRWERPFLDKVSNGYGAIVDYDYQTSSDGRFQIVAARHVTDTVTGLNGTYHYQFSDPKIVGDSSSLDDPNIDEVNYVNYSRFYGFGQATVTDPLGNVTKHDYDNTYDPDAGFRGGPDILNGYELGTWTYDASENLYSASIPTWQVTYVGSWPARFVYKKAQNDYLCNGQPTNDLASCVRKKTTFVHDHNTGNMLEQREYKADGSLYRLTEYAYAPNLAKHLLTLPYRQILKDAAGNQLAEIRYHYDGLAYGALPSEGNLTAQRVWAGGSSYVDTTYADYDAYGNAGESRTFDSYGDVDSIGGGNARLTTIEYDQHGLLPIRVINPKGNTTETAYDYRFQLPVWEEDANDARTGYTYDDFGRLKQVTLPACSDAPTFKAHYYDNAAPYRETIEQRVDDCRGASAYAETHVYYDGPGRKIQSRAQGDAAGDFIVSNVKYDSLGRATHVSVPAEATGSGYQSWTPNNDFTLTEYDTLGRVSRVTQPDGSTTTTFYQDPETAVIDPNSHLKISKNDIFGRLLEVKEFAGTYGTPNWEASAYGITHYAYDEQDNLIEVTDPAGNVTEIDYDLLGRKTGMDDPDMGRWTYQYDPTGNLTQQTDARGVVTTMAYDELDRLTSKSYNDGTPSVSYTYDQGPNGKGRRTSMTDAAGTVAWTYDPQGRMLSETRLFAGAYDILDNTLNPVPGDTAYVTHYSYDTADQVRTITYPDGEVVTIDYTRRGLPTTLTGDLPIGSTATYVTGASYNALANLTSRSLGNGLTTQFTYYTPVEANSRLKRIQIGNMLDMTYQQYDPVGNILSILDQSQAVGPVGQLLSFTYDHLDRLITADAPDSTIPGFDHDYTYNHIGNLTSRDGRGYTYGENGAGPHAVTRVATNTYQYDANGNMITRVEGGITYSQTWNAENKLKQVTWTDPATLPPDAGQSGQPYTTRFVYDGDGNRLLKIEKIPAASANDGEVEITTVYIGQIYEEQFETIAYALPQAQLNGSEEKWQVVQAAAWQTGDALIQPPVLSSPTTVTTRQPGLALPLPPNLSDARVSFPARPLAQQAEPLDPWADAVFDFHTGDGGGSGSPGDVIGGNTNTHFSLGRGRTEDKGWIELDMGPGEEAACRGPGPDLRIYEIGPARETFNVYVRDRRSDGWIQVASKVSKSGDFDPVDINLPADPGSYRWVLIESDGNEYDEAPNAGPDITAVEALHMCARSVIEPVITAPVHNSQHSTSSLAIRGYAGSEVTVEIYDNGVYQLSTTSAFDGAWSVTLNNPAQGQHSIYAVAKRLVGGSWEVSPNSETVVVYHDTEPPESTISTPAPGEWINNGTFSFTGTTTDTVVGVANVEYQLNAGGWQDIPINAGNTVAWRVDLDLNLSTGSDYSFKVRGIDNLGHVEIEKVGSFGVDNDAPTVSMDTAPYQNSLTFTVGWSGDDEGSGLAETDRYELEQEVEGVWQPWLTANATSQPFTGQEGGAYKFRVRAYDQVGNVSGWSESPYIWVDTIPPEVTIAQPQPHQTLIVPSVTVKGTREGPSVSVTVNGQSPTYTGQNIYETSVPLTPGQNQIIVQATDLAQNTTEISRTVFYDPYGPGVTDITPTGVISTVRPTLSGIFIDGPTPNVVSATVTLDGQAIPATLTGFSYTPATDLTHGEHVVSISLADAGGQVGTSSWSFWIDTETWLEIDAPADGSLINRSPVTVTGRTELGTTVDLRVNGQVVGQTTATDGSFSFDSVQLVPGANTVMATVTDSLGNVDQTSHEVTLDTARPAAGIAAVPDRFSPDGDGRRDTTTFELAATAPVSQAVTAWAVAVTDAQAAEVYETSALSPTVLPPNHVWDGLDIAGIVVADGDYSYQLILTATNGLSGTSPVGQVTVDTRAPAAPIITFPVGPTAQTESSVWVQGTAEPEAVIILQSATFTTTTPVDENGLWSVVFPLASGLNTLIATATDASGQVSLPSNQVQVWLTVQPPLYSVDVAPDLATHGTVLTLTATARGDDSPAGPPTALVTADLPEGDSVELVKLGTHPLTTTWHLTWTVTPTTADGLREVGFLGIDAAGFFGTGQTSLLVDSVGPPAPWLRSPSGQIWRGDGQNMAQGRSDPLDRVTLYANGSPVTIVSADANGDWQTGLTLSEGDNLLRARATDLAGNKSGFSNPALVRVDLTPPVVTLNVPATSGRQVELTWSADDGAGSGAVGYDIQFKDDASDWTAWLTATVKTAASFPGLPKRTYYFRARAVDLVGNLSDWVEAGPVEIQAVTKYYTLGGQRVAMRQGGVVYYLHGDHLGSTSLTTDETGSIVAQSRYQPYGQERWTNGPSPTDFTFTGQRNEASFGLMDYNARYYSPVLGRFVSPDTVIPEPESSQGWDRYAYVHNNPVKYTDPSGHCIWDACIVEAWVGLTVIGGLAGLAVGVANQDMQMRDPDELTINEIWASGAGDYFDDIDGAGETEIIGDGLAGMATGYTLGAINASIVAPTVNGAAGKNLGRTSTGPASKPPRLGTLVMGPKDDPAIQ